MQLFKKIFFIYVLILLLVVSGFSQAAKSTLHNNSTVGKQWSADKANAWYANHKWIIGADYIPSNAINQLEMWQAATFDSTINDKELGWAENIGFNTMRVFLHSVAWKKDKDGFNRSTKLCDCFCETIC